MDLIAAFRVGLQPKHVAVIPNHNAFRTERTPAPNGKVCDVDIGAVIDLGGCHLPHSLPNKLNPFCPPDKTGPASFCNEGGLGNLTLSANFRQIHKQEASVPGYGRPGHVNLTVDQLHVNQAALLYLLHRTWAYPLR